jgi:hypothetical protein
MRHMATQPIRIGVLARDNVVLPFRWSPRLMMATIRRVDVPHEMAAARS